VVHFLLNEFTSQLFSLFLIVTETVVYSLHFESANDETGTQRDVIRLVRQILNRALATRVISKQEAMCELGGLGLVLCSETIETVSLSGARKISDSSVNYATMIQKYKNRESSLNRMSFHQFFHFHKNERQTNNKRKQDNVVIPHYVGGSTLPKFPVDDSYARATLLIHKPWSRESPLDGDGRWKEMFEDFLKCPDCPSSVVVAYERARLRAMKIQRGIYYEPVSGMDEMGAGDLYGEPSEEAMDVVELLTSRAQNLPDNTFGQLGGPRGETYNWARLIEEVSQIKLSTDLGCPISFVNVFYCELFLCNYRLGLYSSA